MAQSCAENAVPSSPHPPTHPSCSTTTLCGAAHHIIIRAGLGRLFRVGRGIGPHHGEHALIGKGISVLARAHTIAVGTVRNALIPVTPAPSE